ncbi:hypothetical protein [Vreelandella neptunia]|uniref:Uncharacterized protein n=1 Tax=Vreelandella neptunia TaxID=115551 RepID=A0ABS9S7K4_9GAMM|nr:hypothetical protein [Halomonas neptunia]MCH4812096.1 hypothetical protein [Halomonas neptunia]
MMIPITPEQRDEAEREALAALLDNLSERLTDSFTAQLTEAGHSIALLVAQLDRPNATLH